MVVETEVRVGRNFIRRGDPIKVKLPNKTQFRTGFTFKGWDPEQQKAVVLDPKFGHERWVGLDGIQRVAVTRNGVRKGGAR